MALDVKDLERPYDMQLDLISNNYFVDFEGKGLSSPFKVHILIVREKECRKKYCYKQTHLV